VAKREGNVFLTGQVDFDGMLPALDRWFDEEHIKLLEELPTKPDRPSIIMGCPVWGDKFIQRFLDVCLPTLMAEQNRQALSGACRITIFTDRKGKAKLWGVIRQLTVNGFLARLRIIPDDLIERAMDPQWPLNKYWLLGTCQQLLLQEGGRHGLGFHMLMPDHVYSEAYFPNLFRLAKDFENIAQTSISGDVTKCAPELEAWRKEDGSIAIPDRALGDMTFRHLHGQTRQTIMNKADLLDDLPDSHCMVWIGRDFVRMHCCHMNAAYLSPAIVGRAAVRLYNALDTELPSYMNGEFCVPEIADGMTFVELSDDTKLGVVKRVTAPMLALRCAMTTHFHPAFLTFFGLPNDIPIGEQEDFLPTEQIVERQRALHELIAVSLEPIQREYRAVIDQYEKELTDDPRAEGGTASGMAEVVHWPARAARALRQSAGSVARLLAGRRQPRGVQAGAD
jgi:hypothetical protein